MNVAANDMPSVPSTSQALSKALVDREQKRQQVLFLARTLGTHSKPIMLDRTIKEEQLLQREEVWHLLLQCFFCQVRYGCEETACDTPNCFSHQRRFANKPIRRPTVISARVFALELASTARPLDFLCSHPLRIDSDDRHTGRVSVDLIKRFVRYNLDVQEPTKVMDEASQHHQRGICDGTRTRRDSSTDIDSSKVHHIAVASSHQAKIDQSSIVQNLFNSDAIRKTFRNNLSNVSTSPGDSGHIDGANCMPFMTLSSISPKLWNLLRALRNVAEHVNRDSACRTIGCFVLNSLRHNLSSSLFLLENWVALKSMIHFVQLPPLHITSLELSTGEIIVGVQPTYMTLSTFGDWTATPVTHATILNSLCHALDDLVTPPPMLLVSMPKKVRARFRNKKYLNDHHAANIIYITLIALIGSIPPSSERTLSHLINQRSHNSVLWANHAVDQASASSQADLEERRQMIPVADAFGFPAAIRLAEKVVRVVATRRQHWCAMRTLRGQIVEEDKQHFPVMTMVMFHLFYYLNSATIKKHPAGPPIRERQWLQEQGRSPTPIILEWLRTTFRRSWDGSAIIPRWGTAGAALDMMKDVHRLHDAFGNLLNVTDANFAFQNLSSSLPSHRTVLEYLQWVRQNPTGSHGYKNFRHMLHWEFSIPIGQRVVHFRLMLYKQMFQAWQAAKATRKVHTYFAWLTNSSSDYKCANPGCDHAMCERVRQRHRQSQRWIEGSQEPQASIPSNFWNREIWLSNRLQIAESNYLILSIERTTPLQSAFDQIWGREKRELFKPLKVHMTYDGKVEEGQDHGGVSQEFFRLVFAEAFDPDYGLFIETEEGVNMNWFKPLSSEPLQTFELLGLLVGLAVHNGIAIPANFPIALYQHLCGRVNGVTSQYFLLDAWPTLQNSLRQLQQWRPDQGKIEDVFARDYAFTFEAHGKVYTIDLQEPTPMPAGPYEPVPQDWTDDTRELAPVTHANKFRFARDYNHFLFHTSVEPQFDAFLKGFQHLIPAVYTEHLFPATLRRLVEGFSEIDITLLRQATLYHDYSPSHRVIQDFWTVVSTFDISLVKKLLVFVTASDRIPIQGYASLKFMIERGGDVEKLPTSHTCFSKLVLPEYESKEILEAKLRTALEDGWEGFGFV